MELIKRQDTAIWQVIDDTTQQALPAQQPITNIYHVHINGVAGWLAVLAQMPATTVWAGAAAVGVIGAVMLSVLMVVATIAMQFVFGLVIALVVGLGALVALSVIAGIAKG